ncbi:MAG: hypothetical protein QM773_05305 [Hyphomonadaceae bacterium]
MLCCLLSALMAGNLAAAGRMGWSFVRRPGPVAAIALLGAVAVSLAIAPAVAEHGGHYAARAKDHHRSVLEEILAQPLCSGEAKR